MTAPELTPSVWVVRGGDDNSLASQVKSKGAVAISFGFQRDASRYQSREQLKEAIEEEQPGKGTPDRVGQLYRFSREIRPNDYVLTPEWATSQIHIARCTGDYRFDDSVFGADYPHVLPVSHIRSVARADFPQVVRNTLGSLLTVFRADVALPYIGESPPTLPPEGDPGVWADDVQGQAEGQILEALDNIDHHDFQIFIAGLLEALGYRTRVGGKGADGGVDVLAFPDAFGLAAPRIKVQTKNQKGYAGIQDVGYLNGVLATDERGLFVCTGGFSKDAANATFVRNGQVALVNGPELLDLVLTHYDQMPSSAKEMLPLRRIYIPERPAI
jgi:restriction system protein